MKQDKRPTKSRRSRQEYVYDWLAYHQDSPNGRAQQISHVRDGAAFRELSAGLDERCGRYGSMVRNDPPDLETLERNKNIIARLVDAAENPRVEDVIHYRPVDESFLGPGRMLALCTRLPMNDFQQEDKVQVTPTFTSLEQKVIRLCRRYVDVCSRSRVRLAKLLADQLDPHFANRADIRFKSYRDPSYVWLCHVDPGTKPRRAPRGSRRFAAYMLQLPRVPELNGADLLAIWGMSGTQTLAFAHLLRFDLSHLLDQYGFSMVEMVEPEASETQEIPNWEHLDFVRRLQTEVLLEGVLLKPTTKKVRRSASRTPDAPRGNEVSPDA